MGQYASRTPINYEDVYSVLQRLMSLEGDARVEYLTDHSAMLEEFTAEIFARRPNGSTPSGGLRWHVHRPPNDYQGVSSIAPVASIGQMLCTDMGYSWRRPLKTQIVEDLGGGTSSLSPEQPYLVVFGENLMQIHAPPWDAYTFPKHVVPPTSAIDKQHFVYSMNWSAGPRPEDGSRFHVWALLELASSGVSEEDLFTSSRIGRKFTLRPQPRSSIPFQWVHIGGRTISSNLADTLCSSMSPQQLLQTFNDVLGSDILFSSPGVQDCLKYFIDKSMDFGEAYAHWRTVKHGYFTHFLPSLRDRCTRDSNMRRDAVHGMFVRNANLPPRRVWDLFSNRVIPFYLISDKSSSIPQDVRTVSHSWCSPTSRRSIMTSVNAYQWPVPISGALNDVREPLDLATATTLDHVRVELLNYGAEYVWLDVLCIRQEGRPQDETLRAEEWKTDIPTLGHIYRAGLPCITYFNGLGLPLNLNGATLRSERHWMNRVWTVQEGTTKWLLGGATSAALATTKARSFFSRESLEKIMYPPHVILDRYRPAFQAVQKRHCTTELDRVHGLAHILCCKTLPIYDPNMTPGKAWALLLKHLYPWSRGAVVELHTKCNPNSNSFLPSFEELKRCIPAPETPLWEFSEHDKVYLADTLSLGERRSGTYVQESKVIGKLSVPQALPDEGPSPDLKLYAPLLKHSVPDRADHHIYGQFQPNIQYDVVYLCQYGSLVVEVLGEMEIDGKSAWKAVKRGCIHWARQSRLPIPKDIIGLEENRIVYTPEDDAQRALYDVYD